MALILKSFGLLIFSFSKGLYVGQDANDASNKKEHDRSGFVNKVGFGSFSVENVLDKYNSFRGRQIGRNIRGTGNEVLNGEEDLDEGDERK